MKAVRIHQFGGPESLTYEEIPEPQLRKDQVMVRVRACSLNHLDVWVRKGLPGGFDIGASYGEALGGDIKLISSELQYAIANGGLVSTTRTNSPVAPRTTRPGTGSRRSARSAAGSMTRPSPRCPGGSSRSVRPRNRRRSSPISPPTNGSGRDWSSRCGAPSSP